MKSVWTKLALLGLVAALAPACDKNTTYLTGGSGSGRILTGSSQGGGTIMGGGGQGLNGDGGDGGYFNIYRYGAGVLKGQTKGLVDTSLSVPSVTPYLGTNPYTVAADTTLTAVAVLTGSGQILKGATSNTIRGDDGLTAATGLHVMPGVTLTIPAHYDENGTPATDPFERAYLELDYSVWIEGHIVMGRQDDVAEDDAASDNASDLYINTDTLVMGPNATINGDGTDTGVGSNGGNGSYIDFSCYGVLIQGDISATGGDGDDGGSGGDFYVESDLSGYFLGDINTSGGTGLDAAGTGGDAGYIEIYTSYNEYGGIMALTGDFTSRGGNGPVGGGSGDYHYFEQYYSGRVISTGTHDASGGNATVLGDGGNADYIEFYIYGGPLSVNGTHRSNGGDGAGATGDGGDADSLYYYVWETDNYPHQDYTGGLGAFIAGNLELYGGDGRNGGDGGYLEIDCDDDGYFSVNSGYTNDIYLNVAGLDFSGGDGTVNGGDDSSSSYIEAYYGSDEYGDDYVGDIMWSLDIDLSGGNGGTGTGGDGASLDIEDEYDSHEYHSVTISGQIDLSGGDGVSGGQGGDFYFAGHLQLNQNADVDISGGDATTAQGGDGGYGEIYGDRFLDNTGWIDGKGGDSVAGAGGDGDYVEVFGSSSAHNSGNIRVNGGDGGTTGGNGGDIEIYGGTGNSNSGALDATGGTGGVTDGTHGEIYIDGFVVFGP